MTKVEQAAEAIRQHPDKSDREIARMIGVSHMTVGRARNMRDVPSDVPDVPLARALAIVLAAAESGELPRDDVARIVAARWNVTGETWFHYMTDGSMLRETPTAPTRTRRTVQHRAK